MRKIYYKEEEKVKTVNNEIQRLVAREKNTVEEDKNERDS